MSFEKGPRFSLPPEDPSQEAWITEANRIIEEENWEDDSDIMEIHSRIRDRIDATGDKPNVTPGGTEEMFDGFEKEELNRFAEDHPEKAAHYAKLWNDWAKLAGIDPKIENDEWNSWRLEHPEAKYMGQYRAIAE